jgi:hypothetical protein
MAQSYDVKLPVTAKDEKEAARIQSALRSIATNFSASELENIAQKLKNPLVRMAVLQKLGK